MLNFCAGSAKEGGVARSVVVAIVAVRRVVKGVLVAGKSVRFGGVLVVVVVVALAVAAAEERMGDGENMVAMDGIMGSSGFGWLFYMIARFSLSR